MTQTYQLRPIGVIRKTGTQARIEVAPAYVEGLDGLDGFSHIQVLYWFHQSDTPRQRAVLKVHPRKDPRNPLTGVFATHAPMRPNPIAHSICRIIGIEGGVIRVDRIDAIDGSPLLDIKCFIPSSALKKEIRVPAWV
jgi:tRNA-Thr(GGU) m(6)t(6)A37 methyltransferase TsaA